MLISSSLKTSVPASSDELIKASRVAKDAAFKAAMLRATAADSVEPSSDC